MPHETFLSWVNSPEKYAGHMESFLEKHHPSQEYLPVCERLGVVVSSSIESM